MAPSPAADEFRQKIGKLFDSGLYSDAQIVVGTTTFAVHKSVLCTQSDYFARVFDETKGFVESRTGVIVLDEHINPTVIKSMVEYIYKGNYSTTDDDAENQLAIDVAVYGAAEMFQIDGLKQLAAERVEPVAVTALTCSSVASIVGVIYDSTPDTDRCLRDMFVKAANIQIEKQDLLENSAFNDAMEENGGFAKDLVRVLADWKKANSIPLKCKLCSKVTVVPMQAWEKKIPVTCGTCARVYVDKFWVRAD